ncbi:MAG: DUF4363 family protein [Candidatus Syntrophonatronum acetioxidans]|uniref:DUF4363 family protein n=1 Tax=Candidatus Syntrophonatronum acetioxidans TaxID=1795816 RepID=A0A424YBU9_9FIRM|nr:MAG: DUF4363 family protein [Candidatus Syntrophonatronum acetioxidans]
MKMLGGIIVLLILMVVFSAGVYYQNLDISKDFITSLNQLQEAVENEEWGKVSLQLEEVMKCWKRADAWWTPQMDHQEIDMLNLSVIRLTRLAQNQKKDEALMEITVARAMIENIQELQQPVLRNIF